jgi:hypothetical protein
MSKRVLLASAILCLAGYVYVYATGRAYPPIRSDGYSYYLYLPSWFIYGDTTLTAVARDCCGGVFPTHTSIIRWPDTKRWVNPHPIGVAFMQTPFFLVGHALTGWSNLSPDGFSLYYQHAAGLAGVFWAIAGLFVLRRLLLRHFSDGITAATLLALVFGTSFYHYAAYDSGYSHIYAFFLFASFLLLTDAWHTEPPSWRRAILLGLVAGLTILTRHTNVLLLLAFPAYGLTSRADAIATWRRLATRWRELAVAAAVAFAVCVPQLAIYRQATGRAIISAYGEQHFNFSSPELIQVLVGVQKGLFFWSPLLLAAVAGFILKPRSVRPFLITAVVVMIADTYLIASWWDWQFGASYGHRAFVDTLPLLALGLAAFFAWSAAHAPRKAAAIVLTCVAVFLSVFQMLQYWHGILPMSDMTWEQYRHVFLRFR